MFLPLRKELLPVHNDAIKAELTLHLRLGFFDCQYLSTFLMLFFNIFLSHNSVRYCLGVEDDH